MSTETKAPPGCEPIEGGGAFKETRRSVDRGVARARCSMNPAIAEMKRAARTPKTPRPNLRAIYYRDSHAPTLVVFEVPANVTTRSAVELLGAPRYARVGASKWRLFYGDAEPSWARSWGRLKQLDGVPIADPDPVVEPTPAAFEVGASTWCSWPVHARESLRAVTSWVKGPGVMRTEVLDGATAERVRDLAAQHGLAGLEEVTRG